MPRAAAKKRTRADSSTVKATTPKKARRAPPTTEEQELDAQNIEEFIGSNAVTLRNQQDSPLLRLPTELRETIWTLAFGTRTIHPITSRSALAKSVGKVTYWECRETLSDQEIYDLTLEGAADDDAFIWKAKPLHTTIGQMEWPDFHGKHRCVHDYLGETPVPQTQLCVPIVCKQLYYEATPLMWKTTTLAFISPSDFQDFVKVYPLSAARVQQLTLVPGWERNEWNASLTPKAVQTFTSLQGLHLIIPISHQGKFDVLKHPPSHLRYLANLVTQFQALPLKKERTTVWVMGDPKPHDNPMAIPGLVPNWRPTYTVSHRLEMAEHIREKLLDYYPRRRTGRTRT